MQPHEQSDALICRFDANDGRTRIELRAQANSENKWRVALNASAECFNTFGDDEVLGDSLPHYQIVVDRFVWGPKEFDALAVFLDEVIDDIDAPRTCTLGDEGGFRLQLLTGTPNDDIIVGVCKTIMLWRYASTRMQFEIAMVVEETVLRAAREGLTAWRRRCASDPT